MSVYENLEEQKQFACRVIADHARTTAFSIADGILPGNEGRSYVLRKIMRRAIYHGREHLGFSDSFFYKVCDFVVDQMKDAYPELEVQREFISKMVRIEEERFGATMTVGLGNFERDIYEMVNPTSKAFQIFANEGYDKMQEYLKNYEETYGQYDDVENLVRLSHKHKVPPFFVKNLFESRQDFARPINFRETKFGINWYDQVSVAGSDEEKKLLSGLENNPEEVLSRLDVIYFKPLARNYDTYGTPRDLIRVKLEEKFHISISEDEFNEKFDAALQEIQKQSGIGQTERKSVINPIYHEISEKVSANKFHGYEETQVEDAKVVALVKDDQQVTELKEGEEGLIVLDETPFYAESGGQVGDTGALFNSDVQVKVFDTFAPIAGIVLHKSKVEKGSIKVGDAVTAMVDAEKRDATRRNHTATHLVHAALREVLGTHVKQAGSVVAPNYLRFDYTHYQSLSDAEIKDIEDLVNREILKNDAVNTNVMAIEEAMSSGAMALFGEKYGSAVRVLSIGEGVFSKELCGGTHVRATGDIGSFKITADEAVASGVRRIRAITGFDAFERFREDERMIEKSLGFLKTQRDQLPNAIEKLQEELKRMRRENDELKMKIATGAVGSASSNGSEARDVKGVKVLAQEVENLDSNAVRQLSDNLLNKIKSGVVVIGRKADGKVSLIVRVSDDLTEKIKAGNIIKEIAPIIGGRGGGKADMAEGGGNLPEKLSEAIDASYGAIEKMLS
jgi:alanyl-tRNA synthetase